VEGKTPRTVNVEKWRPSVTGVLTEAGGAVPQWTEDISATCGTTVVTRKQKLYKTRERERAEVL